MSGTSTDQAHGATSVEDTLKDFWATRPRRPRRGRKGAGVAAAIGDRYGMDPIIPRVAFVVATVYGGAGILFYLLGWLFFAEEDDEVSTVEALAGKGTSASSKAFTVLLCLAVIPVFSWFVDSDINGYLGLAVGLGLVFLVHRSRGHLGRVRKPTPAAAYPMATTTMPSHDEAPVRSTDPYGNPTNPPAWDPLGAAPFAWDLPEPSGQGPESEPPVPNRKSKIGLVTVGAAFLAVGLAVVLEPHLGNWITVTHVIGVVLGILGLGMVAGSFTRSGRGLIGLAAPLAAMGIALTVVWPDGFTAEGLGDITARPTTVEQVQDDYRRSVGSIDLDLTALPASGSPVKTSANLAVGDITVIVPKNADVTLQCATGVGDVDCLGETHNGVGSDMARTDLGPDGEGGLIIELDLKVDGPGSVQVRRG
ncbi:MAG: PspC domain-containing protein [Actinomycetota bacterium]|nr:PspC domain-containing protein [Actinomycetota bacterium]